MWAGRIYIRKELKIQCDFNSRRVIDREIEMCRQEGFI